MHLSTHPTSYPTRYQEIAAKLEQELRQHYRCGDYLPAEQQLAARFEVNRHTLRRAIDQLVEKGWVQRRQGVGVLVLMRPFDYPLNAQTRHRIPETPLTEDQIVIFQVPIPEPLRFIEPRETETRTMHALEEYGVMQVKLYEDIARFGHIATTYAYPVKVNGRYVMDPSPIPKFDNPKMDMMPALQLFGAGREKRIYAVPPFTRVESLDFDDHPFTVQQWDEPCAICGSTHSYLDEVVLDDAGNRMFVCSDTDYCRQQSEAKNQ